jgi:hypothetical protein
MAKNQQFVVAAVLEFAGIIALATRFGADRGGTPLLLLGVALVLLGLGLQVKALLQASEQHSPSDLPKDA